jgi:uncharacterized protein
MKKTAAAMWCIMLALPAAVFAYTSPGSPTGFINDFAKVLSPSVVQQLESELIQLQKETSTEISVVTVPTIGDDYIENYSIQLAEEWGIGSEKHRNGILLLLATQDRKLRIEVGYGLEGALPDSVADRIIRNEMVPQLKAGSFDGAVQAGVSKIIAATKGEYSDATSGKKSNDVFAVVFFFLIFGLQWLAAILGRTKEWWLGGALGFTAASGLALFNPFGLSLVVSNTYEHAKRYGYDSPWWTGGGGGSSGGFGGFGGGSFGGGGASGNW